jgi:phage gp46-like protein
MTQFQGDALWKPCPDGGDITINGGEVVRSGGLPGAVWISLFGGNDDDAGDENSPQSWWGNLLESDPDWQVRGRTGTLIRGIPLASGNLLRIVRAAEQDLAWMVSTGVATSVFVDATILKARDVEITVVVQALNTSQTFKYVQNWLVAS